MIRNKHCKIATTSIILLIFSCFCALSLQASTKTIMDKITRTFPNGKEYIAYNYAPSAIQDEDNTYVFYACNAMDTEENIIHDDICVRNTNNQWDITVLTPTEWSWDAYHVCDPSVITGDFWYQGQTYKYLMAYLGCPYIFGQNSVGLAVSNHLEYGWKKVGNKPTIKPKTQLGWGCGQPSLFQFQDNYYLAYTVGTDTETYEEIVPISNTLTVGKPIKVSNLGTRQSSGHQDFLSNVDFVTNGNDVYIICDQHDNYGYPATLVSGLSISRAVMIYKTSCEQIEDLQDCIWQFVDGLTGHDNIRYHNAGFLRDAHNQGVGNICYVSTATEQGSFEEALSSYTIQEVMAD